MCEGNYNGQNVGNVHSNCTIVQSLILTSKGKRSIVVTLILDMASEDAYGSFGAEEYLKLMYTMPGTSTNVITDFMLENLAAFFGPLPRSPDSMKILDYGCGPSLAYSTQQKISCTRVQELARSCKILQDV